MGFVVLMARGLFLLADLPARLLLVEAAELSDCGVLALDTGSVLDAVLLFRATLRVAMVHWVTDNDWPLAPLARDFWEGVAATVAGVPLAFPPFRATLLAAVRAWVSPPTWPPARFAAEDLDDDADELGFMPLLVAVRPLRATELVSI